ncbi:MAG: redoxin domain-containing protein [Roseivirga sp.]|jgi:thiol-disulfide isomerase/thioredoxin|uniref:TlpA family protein disulfide reductase n=1 Tax=Roseivirga sp. TaxID=1964215 RepID=UPI001AFDA095|nr:TlpA disulfide reductase family protein [Roseivirga sp.]MBO6494126.1 redoxin domain-containing protein [Roseivirga sp.]
MMRKPGIIFALFLALCIFACSGKKEPYVLAGKVVNTDADSLFIQLPVDGKFFYRVNSVKVPIDNEGNFSATIDQETSGFTSISFPKTRGSIRTWIEPGYSDTVFIDFEDFSKLAFTGDHADANSLLNNFERIPYFHAFGGKDEKYQKDSVAQRVYDQVMDLNEKELVEIDGLKVKDKITDSFAKAMAMESDLHWKSVFASATWRHYYFKEQLKRKSPYNDEWKELYLKMFDETDLNNPEYLVSNYYRTFAEDYMNLYPRVAGIEDQPDTTLSQDERIRAYHQDRIDNIREKLSGENEELMWSFYLYNAAIQKQYEKVILDSYEELKYNYPETLYDPVLKEHIDPIRAYHTKLEQPMSDKIIMIENADEYTTWEEMVEPYKGEVLYVDLWATWCGPCKDEFEHKEGLYEFLDGKLIKILYVSSDRDEAEGKWKEMVNFYGLEGVNMRISQELFWKIWKDMLGSNTAAIPRYIIVDKGGNMIVKEAARPSEGQKLYDQLASYLE